jgi:hypothetical protein
MTGNLIHVLVLNQHGGSRGGEAALRPMCAGIEAEAHCPVRFTGALTATCALLFASLLPALRQEAVQSSKLFVDLFPAR